MRVVSVLSDEHPGISAGRDGQRNDRLWVAYHPGQMALKRQRQRGQVGIIELHSKRESRVQLDAGLLQLPGLGEQPPQVLMQLPGQRTEPITHRAASIGQQGGGQPAMRLDAGQHIRGPDLILNVASGGKDIG